MNELVWNILLLQSVRTYIGFMSSSNWDIFNSSSFTYKLSPTRIRTIFHSTIRLLISLTIKILIGSTFRILVSLTIRVLISLTVRVS